MHGVVRAVDEWRAVERFGSTPFGMLAFLGVAFCVSILVLIGVRKL